MFKGDKIRGTLAGTALFGAVFVLVCDMLGRVVIFPYELPIELIIGIVGSIIFIGMLLYRLNHGRKAVHLDDFRKKRSLSAVSGGKGERRNESRSCSCQPAETDHSFRSYLAVCHWFYALRCGFWQC